MRKFEIISEEQWTKDISALKNPQCTIINHLKPHRSTKYSAGYDFISPIDIIIPAHGMAKIPTGIKAQMNEDEVLYIYSRSSIGFKTAIRLANVVGVVDSDFYNNPDNEGHIWVKMQNDGNQKIHIERGKAVCQGIFLPYGLTYDDNADGIRNGGLGSTNA